MSIYSFKFFVFILCYYFIKKSEPLITQNITEVTNKNQISNRFWLKIEIKTIKWQKNCLTTLLCSNARLNLINAMLKFNEKTFADWSLSKSMESNISLELYTFWQKGSLSDVSVQISVYGTDPIFGFQRMCDESSSINLFFQSFRNYQKNKLNFVEKEKNEIELQGKCFNATLLIQKFVKTCPWCYNNYENNLKLTQTSSLKSQNKTFDFFKSIFTNNWLAIFFLFSTIINIIVIIIVLYLSILKKNTLKKEILLKNSILMSSSILNKPFGKVNFNGFNKKNTIYKTNNMLNTLKTNETKKIASMNNENHYEIITDYDKNYYSDKSIQSSSSRSSTSIKKLMSNILFKSQSTSKPLDTYCNNMFNKPNINSNKIKLPTSKICDNCFLRQTSNFGICLCETIGSDCHCSLTSSRTMSPISYSQNTDSGMDSV